MSNNHSPNQMLVRDRCADEMLVEAHVIRENEELREKYRKEIEEIARAKHGNLSALDLKILEVLRIKTGLSVEEAFDIKKDVLTPYREYNKKLQEYRQAFVEALRREPNIRRETRNGLKRLQELLCLQDEDVTAVEGQILRKRKDTDENNILVVASLLGMTILAGIGAWIMVSFLNPVRQEQTNQSSAVSLPHHVADAGMSDRI